jgi:hypothetical protein
LCVFNFRILRGSPSFHGEFIRYSNLISFSLAFGDSYTFVQGVLGYPGYSFIGDFLNFAFTPTQLLSNEIVKGVVSPRNQLSKALQSHIIHRHLLGAQIG